MTGGTLFLDRLKGFLLCPLEPSRGHVGGRIDALFHKQELNMQTLSEWQIVLLDNGLWIVPLLGIVALVVFPWKHWNSLWE